MMPCNAAFDFLFTNGISAKRIPSSSLFILVNKKKYRVQDPVSKLYHEVFHQKITRRDGYVSWNIVMVEESVLTLPQIGLFQPNTRTTISKHLDRRLGSHMYSHLLWVKNAMNDQLNKNMYHQYSIYSCSQTMSSDCVFVSIHQIGWFIIWQHSFYNLTKCCSSIANILSIKIYIFNKKICLKYIKMYYFITNSFDHKSLLNIIWMINKNKHYYEQDLCSVTD